MIWLYDDIKLNVQFHLWVVSLSSVSCGPVTLLSASVVAAATNGGVVKMELVCLLTNGTHAGLKT